MCPTISRTVRISTPAMTRRLANVCRRSCQWDVGTRVREHLLEPSLCFYGLSALVEVRKHLALTFGEARILYADSSALEQDGYMVGNIEPEAYEMLLSVVRLLAGQTFLAGRDG